MEFYQARKFVRFIVATGIDNALEIASLTSLKSYSYNSTL